MKYFKVLFLLIFTSCWGYSQLEQSDCNADQSIIDLYQTDAQRLTLNRIFEHNYTYVDSIVIPTVYSDTVLNALIAIYNLTTIPERDTVIDILNIHTKEITSMGNFYLLADSNLFWMQNLQNGSSLSGHPVIDNILTNYSFNLISYTPIFSQSYAMVVFETVFNYNLMPITQSIDTIQGVYSCSANVFGGDGSTIYDTIYPNFVEITFRYGGGDCPSGCTIERFWKFNVYDDCSVEFIGAYGENLPPMVNVEQTSMSEIQIFPNPFIDEIMIKGDHKITSFSIYNLFGQCLIKGNLEGTSIDLSSLTNGNYIIEFETINQKYNQRITKTNAY